MADQLTHLTKENFWNGITKSFPIESERFYKWLDQYKERVSWHNLFNRNSEYQNAEGKNAPAPKYHDLPIALQVGILLQYLIEIKHRYELIEGMPVSWDKWAEAITGWFRMEESFENRRPVEYGQ